MEKSFVLPDFEANRKQLLEGLTYPVAMARHESMAAMEISKLQSLCHNLSNIQIAYAKDFEFENNYEDFKNLLLPIVIRMPAEKVLVRELQARWLSEQNVRIELSKGLRLNRVRELSILLDAFEFPKELTENLQKIAGYIRYVFIPDGLKFSDLYHEPTNDFRLSSEIRERVMVKHTIFARDKKQLELYLLRVQLADALNGVREHGFAFGHVPYPLTKLVDLDGGNIGNGFSFKVDASTISRNVRILPDLRIIEGSIVDQNEYDSDGELIAPYKPVKIDVEVNGIVESIRIMVPGLRIPGFSRPDPKGGHLPIFAKEMAANPEILKELYFDGANIEKYNREVA